MNKGKVFLVGAGPGDPKLITIRGMEAIKKADVIVYDRLASPRLLMNAKPGTEKIFVGKLPDKHTLKQEEINQLLVDLALQGKIVIRLKGGDPCVFGRVGEEAELLAQHQIEFEIIPGITSAIGVPAYAGIPVTHRDYTSSFTIVTGHEYTNKTYSDVNWDKLANSTGTLVFLMGVTNLANIRDELIRFGRSPDLPVALIRWGTWMEQETLTGTLETIVDQVHEANFQSPAVIIVGEVVELRKKLAWFEKKPLFGRRILVTRARNQASELVDAIDDLGGEALEFPVIQLQAPTKLATKEHLKHALSKLPDYDWVVLTSVNGVEYFFRSLTENGIDIRSLSKARIAAVGPKTAEALRERGLVTEALPSKFQAEDLLESLLPDLKSGQNVLLPRADIARDYLPKKLKELGLHVTEVDVYENVVCTDHGVEVLELLRKQAVHVITFTSSSTVTHLFEALKHLGVIEPLELLAHIDIACIGPVTAQTAESMGLKVSYIAKEATVASLIQALIAAKA
ncbi:MAG: uroporphyrinogen-III C-methyltransferase [Paenibacillaceae bacterium]